MKKYLLFVGIVLVVELGILFGFSFFFDTNLLSTLFFGSLFFVFFAFLMGSTGDALSKNSQVAVFDALLGSYKPEHEKATLTIGPFLVGSILCFICYFIIYAIIG
ncbi:MULTISPECIES: hypothetical protein [Bacillus]|uniref:hypothetical protein n=1 Tax=Bacillus TaxID=1386 RepID=UPI000BB97ACA|nr:MULTISPECIES: hypothetical protein [Bacillus]